MIKVLIGIVVGLVIGAGCRWFDIPAPSPPSLVGAMLVMAMTLGYGLTDRLIGVKHADARPATTKPLCGGPSGNPPSVDAKNRVIVPDSSTPAKKEERT